MLILKRKAGEAIVIGGPAVVRVFGVKEGQFKVGIDAPAATEIFRGELATADQIRAAMAEKVPLHEIEDGLDRREQHLVGKLDLLRQEHRREVRGLQVRISELQDRLAEECVEDDPLDEPRRPEDMGSRHGLEVSQRDLGKEPRL